MWLLLAVCSALFAGLTSILAKIGIRNTDSTLATALRTIVVALFAWLMVAVTGAQSQVWGIPGRSLLFLLISGLATGASWLCYFKALQIGDINKVVPIDKSSTVLTILLALMFLGEGVTWPKGLCVVLIAAGTLLMIEKKDIAGQPANGRGWLLYAGLAALFASLTAILGKVGMQGVNSNVGTAIRTMVVLVMAWGIVFRQGTQRDIKRIDTRSWAFIGLSGLATGASWLCYFKALQLGPASVVVPIDKLSILVTVAFGHIVFHERLARKAAWGLGMIVLGTVGMVFA